MNVLFFLTPKQDVAYINENASLRQALEKMRRSGFTAVPIIDKEGIYKGTVSEGDFLWAILDLKDVKDAEHLLLRDVPLSDHNPSVNVNASIEDLAQMSLNQNFVPVVDDRNAFIGIVTRRDILSYYVEHPQRQAVVG